MKFQKIKKKLFFHSVLGWSRRCRLIQPPLHSSHVIKSTIQYYWKSWDFSLYNMYVRSLTFAYIIFWIKNLKIYSLPNATKNLNILPKKHSVIWYVRNGTKKSICFYYLNWTCSNQIWRIYRYFQQPFLLNFLKKWKYTCFLFQDVICSHKFKEKIDWAPSSDVASFL